MKIERDTSSRKLPPTTVAPWRFISTAGCAAERFRQRPPLLRLHHQEISVAELLVLIPERHVLAGRSAKVKHRHNRLAGDGERHHRRRVVMAHRHHVGPRLINAAVNDPLGIELHFGQAQRLGIERVFQDIVGLDQQRRTRPGQQVAAGIARMAHADMAEGVEHALVSEDTVGERQFLHQVGDLVGHNFPLFGFILGGSSAIYTTSRPVARQSGIGRFRKPTSFDAPPPHASRSRCEISMTRARAASWSTKASALVLLAASRLASHSSKR